MHTLTVSLVSLVALVLSGCSAAGSDTDRSPREPIAPVWTTDAEISTLAENASERIEAATGLFVPVISDVAVGSMITVTRSAPDGKNDWIGSYHATTSVLDIDGDCPTETLETLILHEMLHSLGARHVTQDTGVLSPRIWGHMDLTGEDLSAVCAVQGCTAFAPES